MQNSFFISNRGLWVFFPKLCFPMKINYIKVKIFPHQQCKPLNIYVYSYMFVLAIFNINENHFSDATFKMQIPHEATEL